MPTTKKTKKQKKQKQKQKQKKNKHRKGHLLCASLEKNTSLIHWRNTLRLKLKTIKFIHLYMCLELYSKLQSKRFEPKSISSLSSLIDRVSVVLKRIVGDSDGGFDNLCGSYLQN